MTALLLQREIDDLVVRLERLVTVRSLLESYGASAAKFSAISEEIARVREELAQRAKHWAKAASSELSKQGGRQNDHIRAIRALRDAA